MEQGNTASTPMPARANTIEELASALRSYGAEDKFLALSPAAQLGYIDWIDQGTDTEHRERRIRMIVAVIARATTNPAIKLGD
jgi:uncharacterized protein YdeI (YjbR/CyaY-like superfamily)